MNSAAADDYDADHDDKDDDYGLGIESHVAPNGLYG